MGTRIIGNDEIHHELLPAIQQTRKYIWIGTADIKDMQVRKKGKVVSFLSLLNDLLKHNVSIRLLHAKEPGENFRKSFDKYPRLWDQMERQLCPRVHFKIIAVDGVFAYTGSANLTGAGLGMKSIKRRNFESGIITDEPAMVESIMNQFDAVWMGRFCKACGRREFCGDPIV
ncbi:MAG: phospholipase D family protein [Bacteroidales bacterium]|jgi:phosphatidylserine/phosphatidylglycerophosphate/cardiolipin synthase-like enzyme|nr:phospholipase D family protein [Bacteroidales bacterium]